VSHHRNARDRHSRTDVGCIDIGEQSEFGIRECLKQGADRFGQCQVLHVGLLLGPVGVEDLFLLPARCGRPLLPTFAILGEILEDAQSPQLRFGRSVVRCQLTRRSVWSNLFEPKDTRRRPNGSVLQRARHPIATGDLTNRPGHDLASRVGAKFTIRSVGAAASAFVNWSRRRSSCREFPGQIAAVGEICW